MLAALDGSFRCVTVEEAIEAKGRATLREPAPRFFCPFCRRVVWIVGESEERVPHFAHRVAGGACASKSLPDPFATLADAHLDEGLRFERERLFLAHWRRYYRQLDGFFGGIIPKFHPAEFEMMLDVAVRRRIFGLRAVSEADFATILVTTKDFPPSDGTRRDPRRHWYRFWWIVADGDRHRDLWIRPPRTNVLVMGEFAIPPSGGRPSRRDLLRVVPVKLPPLRPHADRPLPDFIEQRFGSWLSRRPAFGRAR